MRKSWLLLAGGLLTISLSACSGGGEERETPASGAAAAGTGMGMGGIVAAVSGPAPASAASAAPSASAADDGTPKTIVFQTYRYSEQFATAVKSYEALHPNITIKLKSLAAGDEDLNGVGLEKFRQTVSTQLLAGQGPDLIDVDELPTDQYVGKNILANLSDQIEQDPSFRKDDYFGNILDNVGTADGVNAIPQGFMVQALVGDEGAIAQAGVAFDDQSWDWDQFVEAGRQLVAKGGHDYAYVYKSPLNLVYEMVTDNLAAFVDEKERKASFDSDAFIGLLNRIKTMEADKVVTFNLRYFLGGSVYFKDISLYSPQDYVSQVKIAYAKPKLYAAPTASGQGSGGYFTTYDNLAINAHSKVQAAAWDFLKYLLSDAVPDPAIGFPLNRSLYEKQVGKLLQDGKAEAVDESTGKSITVPVAEADLQGLDSLLAAAAHPSSQIPGIIEEALFDELPAFFNGQKSAEAVAKLIQNKATTYLNE